MSFKVGLKALLGVAVIALSACSSENTQRLLREPAMPPVFVTRAAMNGPYWQNVTIQEVTGTPEFRWFDGGAVLTTRPTRRQALEVFSDDLNKVGMLSSNRVDSEYMLYVSFDDLHGPDVVLFSDKHASAVITFRLVNWRTGCLIKAKRIVASYSADLGGIMPEEGRAFFGSIALADDDHAFPYLLTDPEATLDQIVRFKLLLSKSTPISEVAQIGPLNGTSRRVAAWHGLLNLAFDEFMNDLSADGSVVFKKATSCDSLAGYAPHGFNSRRAGVQWIETDKTFAVDCPGVDYMESIAHRVYPSHF